MFTIFPWLNVNFSCFKQFPLNFTLSLLPTKFNVRLRILADFVGALFSSDNPLGFHDKIFLLLASTALNYLCIGWNTSQFCLPSSSKWLSPRK